MIRQNVFLLQFTVFLPCILSAQEPVTETMSTSIIVKTNNIIIPAVLNNSLAARDFKTRLPFVVSGHRSSVDYCCAAKSGNYNPDELQSGWKNGDISLAGGWFAVLFDGEETSKIYSDMMIIAHIHEKHLDLVKNLPAEVTFTVELAE